VSPARYDNTKRSQFADRLKALPAKPGVYMMRGGSGDVIYVLVLAQPSRDLLQPASSQGNT